MKGSLYSTVNALLMFWPLIYWIPMAPLNASSLDEEANDDCGGGDEEEEEEEDN